MQLVENITISLDGGKDIYQLTIENEKNIENNIHDHFTKNTQ